MDQKITAYLESLVLGILQTPVFGGLPEDQKQVAAQKIRDYLNSQVIDLIVDRLTPGQLNSLKDLPADSAEMEDKIEQYAATMPFLAQDVEEKLKSAVFKIKQNPQLLN